jgi:fatty-acyl-CoA synthase
MLTHDAVLWQYVSCVVNAEIAEATTLLHALPLYHCAQLDVFFGPAIYVGATNVITAKPVPDNLLPLLAKHRITSSSRRPRSGSRCCARRCSTPPTCRPGQGLLRRVHHAGGGAAELAARLPQVRLWNLYGQTEIAPLATMLGPTTSCASRARPGARCSERRDPRGRRRACATWRWARSARSCTARRT